MERKAPIKSVSSSLLDLRKKARAEKKYRFRHLYTLLNEELLYRSFHELKKSAATGVDKVTWWQYESDLKANIDSLVERLKQKRYRAKLVRRRYIPKSPGKQRPLGIPALEDKLVQRAARSILEAIYEEDFLECNMGYRPGRGAQQLVKNLQHDLYCGKRINCVVEADIRSFFDKIDHDWLVRMLEKRINDRAMIRLIRKWLRAGILEEDGAIIHPATGSPQGGIISPMLANVYLHYALDLWVQKRFARGNRGEMLYVRYADDFICAFQYGSDARRFYAELPGRLGKFALEVSEEKTNIIEFSRFNIEGSRPFTFLGLDFYWARNRGGKPMVKRCTNKKKFRQSLRNLKEWIKENRNQRIGRIAAMLRSKLQGYWNYYGVIGNSEMLYKFNLYAQRIVFKWLNRRSERKSYNWAGFNQMWKELGIPGPRIVETPYRMTNRNLELGLAQ